MKVLVAIDSSSDATAIIEYLLKIEWSEQTHLQLFTVVEKTSSWDSQQQFINLGKQILEERVLFLQKHLANCLVSGELAEGDAAEQIIRLARLWHADLIVIGSHGDTGYRKPGLGSVASRISDSAPCNVEIVKIVKTSPELQRDQTHSFTTDSM